MTQEEKNLFLKDICSRIPYGVKATTTLTGWNDAYLVTGYNDDKIYLNCPVYDRGDDEWDIEFVKPYLRPMSSMTGEEKRDFENQFGVEISVDERWGNSVVWNPGSSDDYIDVEFEFEFDYMCLISEWLDKKMFDWRRIKKNNKMVSMIKAGLALEAPEGMYI